MPRTLTDEQVAEIRALAAAGRDPVELADEFGVSRRHVDRLVRGDQRKTIETVDGAVSAAVRKLLDGMELEPEDLVLAASAEVLAAKLDGIRHSDAAASAAAAPGLVRQLTETLRGLRGEEEDATAALRRMLEPLVRS